MPIEKGPSRSGRESARRPGGKKTLSATDPRVVRARARAATIKRKNLALQQEKIDRLKALTGATTDQAAMEIALDRALGEVEADEQIRQALRDRWAAADRGELHAEEVFPSGQLPPDARQRLEDAGVELADLPPPKRYSTR